MHWSTNVPRLGLGGSLLVSVILFSGCSARQSEPITPSPPLAAEAEPAEASGPGREIEELRETLSGRDEEMARLREDLGRLKSARVALEEENASLELELSITLEELLRIQANLKNVHSRAFAVSRIAEVRVELESLRTRKDRALADRLERADTFLDRADEALGEGNVGGAAFLAERAGELVRQCRTITEVRSRESKELLPIVPHRWIEVHAGSNLRRGPGLDNERIDTVPAGTRLEAVGRLGEWFQVRTPSGGTGWIHESLVE